jgi:hypothetical protein
MFQSFEGFEGFKGFGLIVIGIETLERETLKLGLYVSRQISLFRH